jgi:hypothetical protein
MLLKPLLELCDDDELDDELEDEVVLDEPEPLRALRMLLKFCASMLAEVINNAASIIRIFFMFLLLFC